MTMTSTRWLCALSTVMLAACETEPAEPRAGGGQGGAAGGTGAAGGSGGGDPIDFSCAAGEVPTPLTFHADDYLGPPLAEVHACVANHPDIPCIDTEADGLWRLCAPAEAELAITYEKQGYLPTLVPLRVGAEPSTFHRDRHLRMSPESICAEPWDEIGVECPPVDEALLFVKVVENEPEQASLPQGIGDVSVELTPAAGIGPFYADALGNTDLDRTATSAPNGNAFASGLMEGDEQIVALSHPSLACGAGDLAGSWPGPGAEAVRIPMRAGFRTFVVLTCE